MCVCPRTAVDIGNRVCTGCTHVHACSLAIVSSQLVAWVAAVPTLKFGGSGIMLTSEMCSMPGNALGCAQGETRCLLQVLKPVEHAIAAAARCLVSAATCGRACGSSKDRAAEEEPLM